MHTQNRSLCSSGSESFRFLRLCVKQIFATREETFDIRCRTTTKYRVFFSCNPFFDPYPPKNLGCRVMTVWVSKNAFATCSTFCGSRELWDERAGADVIVLWLLVCDRGENRRLAALVKSTWQTLSILILQFHRFLVLTQEGGQGFYI